MKANILIAVFFICLIGGITVTVAYDSGVAAVCTIIIGTVLSLKIRKELNFKNILRKF